MRPEETLAAEQWRGGQARIDLGHQKGQEAGIPEEAALDVEVIEGQRGEGSKRHSGDEQRRGHRPNYLPACDRSKAAVRFSCVGRCAHCGPAKHRAVSVKLTMPFMR